MTISARLSIYAGLSLLILAPNPAWTQVPTRASEPRLVVPTDRATPPPGQPTAAAPEAAAPEASAPAPVAAPAPAPTGVTQLPASPSTPPSTSSSSQAATADKRSYGAAKSALVVDGQNVPARSVEGGAIWAEVVVERIAGASLVPKKHIAGLNIEEVTVTAGLDSKPLNDWIAASWKGASRKSGSVLALDYDSRIVGQRDFTNATITKTVLPALDGASKDPAQLTVSFAPEMIRTVPAAGGAPYGGGAKTQKQWNAAGFRFEMDGLDGTKVSKVSPITVVQSVVERPVGEQRDYQKEPGTVDFQNFKVTFAVSSAETWARWHDEFVVKGNNGDEREKSGAIVYLSATRTEELGRVNLSHCGIVRLSSDKAEAGRETVSRMTAELYCEGMDLVVGATK